MKNMIEPAKALGIEMTADEFLFNSPIVILHPIAIFRWRRPPTGGYCSLKNSNLTRGLDQTHIAVYTVTAAIPI